MPHAHRALHLRARPEGELRDDVLELRTGELPDLADGQLRVATRFISIDPAMRIWMTEQKSYWPPVPLGEVMRASAIGEVVESSNAKFPVGAWVSGMLGVQEGLVLCNAMHITASVYINDAEDGLLHDYDVWLEKLAPHEPTSQYHHNRTGEDNADAHHKRQIMGREVVVAITKGKLDFGPWEQIFYGEFDGRRPKRVLVKVIGE